MNARMLKVLVAVTGGVILTMPALAHHGTGISYDNTKAFNMDGVVTEFRYANPHPQLYFDVTDEKGTVVHWTAEVPTDLGRMIRAGWTKARSLAALKQGTRIKVRVAPAKAGGAVGLANRIQSEKGEPILCMANCDQLEPLK